MTHKEDIEQIRRLINEIRGYEASKYQITDYFDISSLSREDIQSMNTDLSVYVNGRCFIDDIMVAEGRIVRGVLSEDTKPIGEVRSWLTRNLNFKPFQIAEVQGANGLSLILLYVDIGINEEIIVNEMQGLGWSVATVGMPMVVEGLLLKSITFDPMTQPNVNDIVEQIGNLLHWTPSVNTEAIMSQGLIPKSENSFFRYPPHIHLFSSQLSEDKRKNLAWKLFSLGNNADNSGNYTLINVNIGELQGHKDFFYDPRCEGGFYTDDAIEARALSVIGAISFDMRRGIGPKQANINYF